MKEGAREGLVDHGGQPLRFRIRRLTEQKAVEHGEHRRVDPDGQGQRHHH
jgi:hypothetical protein